MLAKILLLLINTTVFIYTTVVLLRFMLQVARADFYNPISQFVVKATDPLLKPLRRVIPGLGGVDVPSLVLAALVQLLGMLLLMLLLGGFSSNPLVYTLLPLLGVLAVLLKLFFFAIIIVIIVSWVAPNNYNPAAILLRQVTEPVMQPFRRILPPMGGLDFSPMIAMFVIYILQSIVLPELLFACGGGFLMQLGFF